MALFESLQDALGGDYELQRELGGGGMSSVFVARDLKLDRPVVVKVLSEHLSAGVSVERFNREILVAAGLQHPHIVTVHSAGEAAGLPYFVMPFVEGESLRKRLSRDGAMDIPEVISILRDVSRALEYAHDKGIVHRDIKPDNILLTSGSAVIADFGVAKALDSARHTPSNPDDALTAVGSSLGTPQYMAPEQAAGDSDVDHRADIYALGITAYEMLTGDPPFADRQPSKLLAAHIVEPPAAVTNLRTDIPAPLADLVMSMLAKDPADRPQSVGQIAATLESSVSSAQLTPETGAIQSAARLRNRGAISMGLGAVAVGVIAVMFFTRTPTAAPMPDMGESVAVLPFVNVGGDPAQDYFADGMTDELISALNRIPDLAVSSRTAVFAFKGTNASVRAIAESLQVSTLLEGTVRQGGDRMRLTARLVNAEDGSALWSETYEREVSDVFAVQDELTSAIAEALEDRFTMAMEPAPDPARGTDDLAAYDLYLRGRYFFQQRGADALQNALDYFRQAADRDSSYAEAYSGIADVLSLMPLYTSASADSIMPVAMAAAERAVSLNASLATAQASLAALYNSTWQWDKAETAFREATTLDPKYATAFQWYGEFLGVQGRLVEAVEALGRAAELDPVSPVIHASYGSAMVQAGRAEEGISVTQRGVALAPDLAVARMMLGAAFLYARQPTEALPHLERAYADAPVAPVKGLLGYTYGVTGDTAAARALLVDTDSTAVESGNAGVLAHIYLGLGNPDRAMYWLQVAVDNHDAMFASESMATSVFEPLYDHPEFHALISSLGLDPARFSER